MGKLTTVEKSINEIIIALSRNQRFCALLTDDTSQADQHNVIIQDWTNLITQDYIKLYPASLDSAANPVKNTFLILLINGIAITNDDLLVDADIYITTDDAHILLDNFGNRLIKLSDEVLTTLDGLKLSSAGSIDIESITHVMLTEWRPAYRVHFTFTDQVSSRKAEI